MKKIIITISILMFTITLLFSSIPDDWIEYDKQLKKMVTSNEYIEGLPKLVPIFDLNGEIYEFEVNGYNIYKRNILGEKKKIALAKSKLEDGAFWNYSAYKSKDTIYIFSTFFCEAGGSSYMIILNEKNGQLYEYDTGYNWYNKKIYIDDEHLFESYLTNNPVKIETTNIELYGIGNNTSKHIILEKNTDNTLLIKSFDKNKIVLLKDFIEYHYEDKATNKTYSKKEALMYYNYYYLKFLMKTFGEIGEYPFGDIGLDYDAVSYSDEDIKKIYMGADPNDMTILSIEEFTKTLKNKDNTDTTEDKQVEVNENHESFFSSILNKIKNFFK